jgi:hypothetical protein
MNALNSKGRTARVVAAATLILICSALISAQPSLERPRTSSHGTVSQKIGVTEVSVNYHRPGVKGRVIWGDLTPYDQVWRTGANEVTTITFADPVTVAGSPLPAGTYGLFTIPRKGNWTVIFSSNTTTWGTVYDSTKDVLKIDAAPRQAAEPTEWMMFSFSDLSDTSATLELRWEKLVVPVRIGVNTVDVILGKARKEFSAGPDTGRWQMLRQAAGYAWSQNVSLEEALSWIDRSLAVNSNFQSLCMKSDILDRFGDKAKSGALLDEAIASAKEADVVSYAQSLRRDNRAARAVEIVEKFAEKKGGSYAIDRALGESYDAAGDRAKALSSLESAAKQAPGAKEKEEVAQLIQSLNERK